MSLSPALIADLLFDAGLVSSIVAGMSDERVLGQLLSINSLRASYNPKTIQKVEVCEHYILASARGTLDRRCMGCIGKSENCDSYRARELVALRT